MTFPIPIIDGVLSIGEKLIDKLIPDPEAKAKAKQELIKLNQQGDLQDMQIRLSAIIADSNSKDPWTSRARPSFLYVVYVLLLASIPVGIAYAFAPDHAERFIQGFQLWLHAIPEPILTLFGVVMTGYIGGRSWEKVRGVAK